MKSIVETLLAPVDEASGTARSLTAVELGDIMTKMDRDNNGDVDFEEFYYWYEAEMEKKQVKLDLQSVQPPNPGSYRLLTGRSNSQQHCTDQGLFLGKCRQASHPNWDSHHLQW